MNRLTIILLIIAACTATAGQFLFKLGADGKQDFWEFVNLWIILGLSMYGVSTILWIYSMSSAKLLDVYPFTMLTFVLVYILGVFALGEKLTMSNIVGISLIFLGLFVIAR